jgi:fatty-acyl-CoA synthase
MTETLSAGILESATRYGSRTAYVFPDGTLGFAEWVERAEEVARGLLALGVHKGDRIGLWLPNVREWPICELACAFVGAVVVPINLRLRSRELAHALKYADLSVLIMTPRFLTNPLWERLLEIVPELPATGADRPLFTPAFPALRHVVVVGERGPDERGGIGFSEVVERGRAVPAALVEACRDAAAVDDLLFMFWTSGTTSAPKGVLHTHRVVSNIRNVAAHIGLDPDDVVVANKPWFYIAGNFWTMLMPALTGATVVVCQTFRAEEVLGAMSAHPVNVLMATPFALGDYLAAYDPAVHRVRPQKSVVIGGAPPGLELIARTREVFRAEDIIQVYGMTETQGYSLATARGADDRTVAETVGWPLPGFECRIVDPETARDVPDGTAGELWVRGRTLKEYYKKPWTETFRQDFWFPTGDLFLRTDRGYQVVGRIKDVIKVGGENVAAEEVEQVLLTHPAIVKAAVVGVPDAARGEVCAAFVQWRDEPVPEAALREWCRSQMAPFKVPHYIRTVAADAWPLTDSLKIRKTVLREQLLAELGLA